MISSLLVFQLGQARVWFAMSRDGLFPRIFGRVHPRFQTPDFFNLDGGIRVVFQQGLLDIGNAGDLSNIGTLFAFALGGGRRAHSSLSGADARELSAPPGGPLAPIVTIFPCLLLMAGCDHELGSGSLSG